jgi:putative ABC transport system permease protein
MFNNNVKFAFRNLKKNKSFSLLNILGLAIGIVSSALIFLWIEYTYQHNRILPGSDELFQVKNNQKYGDDIYTMSATSGPLGPVLSQDVPGVSGVTRILSSGGVFGHHDKSLNFNGVYADNNFFTLFKFPIESQSDQLPLSKNDRIAISTKMSEALFGTTQSVGKSIILNKEENFVVSAVYDRVSENMTMNPDWIISLGNRFLNDDFKNNWSHWGACGMRTYVSLQQGVDYLKINQQIKNLIFQKSGGNVDHSIFLYPYSRLSWYNTFSNGIETPSEGTIKYIKLFFLIAIVILLIACINFMNLSTAKSEHRAREIGLKKAIGIHKSQLVYQFYTESILVSFIAVVIAILSLYIIVPAFGNMINVPLTLSFFSQSHIAFFCGVGLFCGLLAGTYPAFFLASFKPLEALNNRVSGNSGTNFIRKSLVVFQFSISIVIIICTIVISNQITHTKNRDLGFSKDKILSIPVSNNLSKNFDRFRTEMISNGHIEEVAMTDANLFNMYNNGGGFTWKGYDSTKDALITFNGMTSSYLKVMDIKVTKGRGFYENPKQEEGNIIINPALAKLMGDEGKIGGIINRGNDPPLTIIGITAEFVVNDIYGVAEPLIFFPKDQSSFAEWSSIVMKLPHDGNVEHQLESIRKSVKSIDPENPFNYNFFDESFNYQFNGIMFVGRLVFMFGLLSIAISCLGLFGLAAFMAQRRTKEIGVRKVLGATVAQIIGNLSLDFIKLIVIAIIIASPIAYYFMDEWLSRYHYRIEIQWWVFLLAAIISLLITLVTVGFQAIKAALMNPVKSLKTE